MTRQRIEVAILEHPGSMKSAVYGLADLFQSANRICEGFEAAELPCFKVSRWALAEGEVKPLFGEALEAPQLVIVPPVLEGQAYLQPEPALRDWLRTCYQQGAITSSACAGAFLLADAGLLEGRKVTTHWGLEDAFRQQYPTLELDIDQILISDTDLVTAGGVMSWLDLGLHLIGRFVPPSVVMELGRFLLVDTAPRQQSYYKRFSPPMDHGDSAVLATQQLIHREYAQPLTIRQMSEVASLGERTLLRRFQKATGFRPGEYLQQQRIQKARDSLELSQQSVEQIAWQVGYEDVSAFRKMFLKQTGLTPRQYRQRFSGSNLV